MALTSYFVTMTAGAAAVKGAYTQVVASTPSASSRMFLTVGFANGANRFFLIDLATGTAGAETVVVADLAVNADGDALTNSTAWVTLDIPAGTRLAVRCAGSFASSTLEISVLLDTRALGSLATPVTYGTSAAAVRGTQVDPGGTVSTKGAYVQLTASTTARSDALLVCIQPAQSAMAITGGTVWQLDVATGAAGAETVVVPDLLFEGNVNVDSVRPGLLSLPVVIASGTRLAVRCQCNRNTATERILCVTLIGMQDVTTTGGGATSAAYLG